jgi:hypothetical protein
MVGKKRLVADSRQLEKARKRFGAWRQSRNGVARIPDELWQSAVVAAKEVGVYKASKALRLDYSALKKHFLTATGRPPLKPTRGFVEFATGAAPLFTQWAVEMEDGYGARMRVEVRNAGGPDVVGLSRAFWGEES